MGSREMSSSPLSSGRESRSGDGRFRAEIGMDSPVSVERSSWRERRSGCSQFRAEIEMDRGHAISRSPELELAETATEGSSGGERRSGGVRFRAEIGMDSPVSVERSSGRDRRSGCSRFRAEINMDRGDAISRSTESGYDAAVQEMKRRKYDFERRDWDCYDRPLDVADTDAAGLKQKAPAGREDPVAADPAPLEPARPAPAAANEPVQLVQQGQQERRRWGRTLLCHEKDRARQNLRDADPGVRLRVGKDGLLGQLAELIQARQGSNHNLQNLDGRSQLKLVCPDAARYNSLENIYKAGNDFLDRLRADADDD